MQRLQSHAIYRGAAVRTVAVFDNVLGDAETIAADKEAATVIAIGVLPLGPWHVTLIDVA